MTEQEFKDKYATGNYVCYKYDGVWSKTDELENYGTARVDFALILKKHEEYADAFISGETIRDRLGDGLGGVGVYYYIDYSHCFFNSYEEDEEYVIEKHNPYLEKRSSPSVATQEQSSVLNGEKAMEILSIKDDNGKEFKYEKPDFDDYKLSYFVDGCIIGHVIDEGQLIPLKIYTDGHAYGDSTRGKYDLKPIKPKWYEDESKFDNGVLLVKQNARLEVRITYSKDDYFKESQNGWRLATEEEALSLYYEGKDE